MPHSQQINEQTELNNRLQTEAVFLSGLLRTGHLQRVETALHPLLQVTPHWGMGWKLLATALTMLGRHDEAWHAVNTAAEYLREDAELFNIAATLHRDMGQLHQAIACYLKAAALNPNLPEVHNNLGGAFMLKGELAHAVTAFVNAIRLHPAYPEAHLNLGNALLAQNRLTEAIEVYLQAAKLQPGMQQALSLACLAMLQNAQWRQLKSTIHELQENLDKRGYQAALPFIFNGLPGFTRQQHLHCAQQFATEQYGGFIEQEVKCTTPMSQQGRLRIGYLSADFHEHATAYLLAGVLESHDREKFEIFAYSYGPPNDNPMRTRVKNACDGFADIQSYSHEAAATLIAADKIDILIDLKGFTENGRPQINALRPAPVIASWLGYPSTLGSRRLADYLISDPIVTPLDHQSDYSETLALMPNSYQPTDMNRQIAARPTRQQAGLPENAFIFCSFNQMYKLTPEVFEVWCNIIKAVPGSVLWLLEASQTAMANLKQEAAQCGLTKERLIFAEKLPQAMHLARLQLADLALDTFPYTSHTTGSDALWVGVPLLTRIGDTFGSRVAASLLTAANLPELITVDWEKYEELAISLAQNPSKLRQYHRHLISTRRSLPLFDTPRFTRHLEALFSTIRRQQLTGVIEAFEVK